GHLMQSAERQSASRQMPVDRLDAEGQHGSPARGRTFETLDALAKLFDNRKAGGRPHIFCNSLGRMLCSLFVPFTPRESIADKFPFEGSLNQAGPRSSCKGHSRRCTCRWMEREREER